MTRVRIGGEKELLLTFLDQQRDVVVWKLEGLTDDQVRQRPLPSSGLYLLGLVKHLADVEQYWLCEAFGRPREPGSVAASNDVEVEEGDTTDSVLAYYNRARVPRPTRRSPKRTSTPPARLGSATPSAFDGQSST
jgi:Protein of unknown function (DUF664)